MVTEAQHQALLAECEQWREQLRLLKEDINHCRNLLYQAAAGKTDHDFLKEVEHYHNQFHIQQINIHDLKHAIRNHVLSAEHHPDFGHKIPHHQLELDYRRLSDDITTLLAAFKQFLAEKK